MVSSDEFSYEAILREKRREAAKRADLPASHRYQVPVSGHLKTRNDPHEVTTVTTKTVKTSVLNAPPTVMPHAGVPSQLQSFPETMLIPSASTTNTSMSSSTAFDGTDLLAYAHKKAHRQLAYYQDEHKGRRLTTVGKVRPHIRKGDESSDEEEGLKGMYRVEGDPFLKRAGTGWPQASMASSSPQRKTAGDSLAGDHFIRGSTPGPFPGDSSTEPLQSRGTRRTPTDPDARVDSSQLNGAMPAYTQHKYADIDIPSHLSSMSSSSSTSSSSTHRRPGGRVSSGSSSSSSIQVTPLPMARKPNDRQAFVNSSDTSSVATSSSPLGPMYGPRGGDRTHLVPPSAMNSAYSSGTQISWGDKSQFNFSSTGDAMMQHIYIEAAEYERAPITSLERFCSGDGFEINRCFAVLRYRKDVIEEFRCRLVLHRDEPVFKLDNLSKSKSRLLLPDLQLGPTTLPSALDSFAYYSWPHGDRQLHDLKHVCGVMCTFRNMREPIYFATPETDQQMLADCLTIVRRAAIMLDARRRELFGDKNRQWQTHAAPPSPSSMLVASGFQESGSEAVAAAKTTLDSHFVEALNGCARKLATVRAVDAYWSRENEVFTIFWQEKKPGHGKYKSGNKFIYINPYKPDLVVADKKGHALSDILDMTTLSCSRRLLGDPAKLPSCIKRYSKAPHICFCECMNHTKRMFFSFLTSEDLKDFIQVVATLGHMQTSRLV